MAAIPPRLNARRFEALIVRRIRSSILTEGLIDELTKVVAKELDGLVREQRRRLETIESELAEVRRGWAGSGTSWRPPTMSRPTRITESRPTLRDEAFLRHR